jgi:hypothetical protein
MTSTWTLRCRACRRPLGQVRNGDLSPLVPILKLHRTGLADLRCPACGEVKPWKPGREELSPRR